MRRGLYKAFAAFFSFVHNEQKYSKRRFSGGHLVAIEYIMWYNSHTCWKLKGEFLYFCVKKFPRKQAVSTR